MQTKIIERYFFFGLLLATLLFTFLIFRPFWVVLVLGISFSTVLFPVFEWLRKRGLPNWLSSIVTVLLFTIVLCGPLFAIGAMVFNQTENVYHDVLEGGNAEPFLESIDNAINKFLPPIVVFDVNEKITELASYVSDNITNIFKTTVSAFSSFLLMLLIIFYFLKDGAEWKKALVLFSPLADVEDEKIISKFSLSINAIIKGYLFIALLQGILMGAGLWLFNIPNPALWGVVASVASLIPTIGTAFVSAPAIIFLFATGQTASAIGLLAWSAIVVGMIDNILSPLVVGTKINTPALFILFSVLGGISLLGPVGVLVGPLTISLLYTLVSIYRNDFA